MNHAEDLARALGSREVTVTEQRRLPDGTLETHTVESSVPLNRPASQVVNSLGWRSDNLGLRGAKRVTFTMLRSEYDQRPFHTQPPARTGWVPTFIAKHTDVVRWTYKPVPVVGDLSVVDQTVRVLS